MHLYHIRIAKRFALAISIQFSDFPIGTLAPKVVANEISATKIIPSAKVKLVEDAVRDLATSPRNVTRVAQSGIAKIRVQKMPENSIMRPTSRRES